MSGRRGLPVRGAKEAGGRALSLHRLIPAHGRAGFSTANTIRTMRAAVRTTYGPPEVVHITDVPAPEVGPGDVRVAVHATTVNRTDCGIRAAKPFFIRALTGLVRPRATILSAMSSLGSSSSQARG
jgi:hypothetical protein